MNTVIVSFIFCILCSVCVGFRTNFLFRKYVVRRLKIGSQLRLSPDAILNGWNEDGPPLRELCSLSSSAPRDHDIVKLIQEWAALQKGVSFQYTHNGVDFLLSSFRELYFSILVGEFDGRRAVMYRFRGGNDARQDVSKIQSESVQSLSFELLNSFLEFAKSLEYKPTDKTKEEEKEKKEAPRIRMVGAEEGFRLREKYKNTEGFADYVNSTVDLNLLWEEEELNDEDKEMLKHFNKGTLKKYMKEKKQLEKQQTVLDAEIVNVTKAVDTSSTKVMNISSVVSDSNSSPIMAKTSSVVDAIDINITSPVALNSNPSPVMAKATSHLHVSDNNAPQIPIESVKINTAMNASSSISREQTKQVPSSNDRMEETTIFEGMNCYPSDWSKTIDCIHDYGKVLQAKALAHSVSTISVNDGIQIKFDFLPKKILYIQSKFTATTATGSGSIEVITSIRPAQFMPSTNCSQEKDNKVHDEQQFHQLLFTAKRNIEKKLKEKLSALVLGDQVPQLSEEDLKIAASVQKATVNPTVVAKGEKNATKEEVWATHFGHLESPDVIARDYPVRQVHPDELDEAMESIGKAIEESRQKNQTAGASNSTKKQSTVKSSKRKADDGLLRTPPMGYDKKVIDESYLKRKAERVGVRLDRFADHPIEGFTTQHDKSEDALMEINQIFQRSKKRIGLLSVLQEYNQTIRKESDEVLQKHQEFAQQMAEKHSVLRPQSQLEGENYDEEFDVSAMMSESNDNKILGGRSSPFNSARKQSKHSEREQKIPKRKFIDEQEENEWNNKKTSKSSIFDLTFPSNDTTRTPSLWREKLLNSSRLEIPELFALGKSISENNIATLFQNDLNPMYMAQTEKQDPSDSSLSPQQVLIPETYLKKYKEVQSVFKLFSAMDGRDPGAESSNSGSPWEDLRLEDLEDDADIDHLKVHEEEILQPLFSHDQNAFDKYYASYVPERSTVENGVEIPLPNEPVDTSWVHSPSRKKIREEMFKKQFTQLLKNNHVNDHHKLAKQEFDYFVEQFDELVHELMQSAQTAKSSITPMTLAAYRELFLSDHFYTIVNIKARATRQELQKRRDALSLLRRKLNQQEFIDPRLHHLDLGQEELRLEMESEQLQNVYKQICAYAIDILEIFVTQLRDQSIIYMKYIEEICDISYHYQHDETAFLDMIDMVKEKWDLDFLSFVQYLLQQEQFKVNSLQKQLAVQQASQDAAKVAATAAPAGDTLQKKTSKTATKTKNLPAQEEVAGKEVVPLEQQIYTCNIWIQILTIIDKAIVREYEYRHAHAFQAISLYLRYKTEFERDLFFQHIVNMTIVEDLPYLRALCCNMIDAVLYSNDETMIKFLQSEVEPDLRPELYDKFMKRKYRKQEIEDNRVAGIDYDNPDQVTNESEEEKVEEDDDMDEMDDMDMDDETKKAEYDAMMKELEKRFQESSEIGSPMNNTQDNFKNETELFNIESLKEAIAAQNNEDKDDDEEGNEGEDKEESSSAGNDLIDQFGNFTSFFELYKQKELNDSLSGETPISFEPQHKAPPRRRLVKRDRNREIYEEFGQNYTDHFPHLTGEHHQQLLQEEDEDEEEFFDLYTDDDDEDSSNPIDTTMSIEKSLAIYDDMQTGLFPVSDKDKHEFIEKLGKQYAYQICKRPDELLKPLPANMSTNTELIQKRQKALAKITSHPLIKALNESSDIHRLAEETYDPYYHDKDHRVSATLLPRIRALQRHVEKYLSLHYIYNKTMDYQKELAEQNVELVFKPKNPYFDKLHRAEEEAKIEEEVYQRIYGKSSEEMMEEEESEWEEEGEEGTMRKVKKKKKTKTTEQGQGQAGSILDAVRLPPRQRGRKESVFKNPTQAMLFGENDGEEELVQDDLVTGKNVGSTNDWIRPGQDVIREMMTEEEQKARFRKLINPLSDE